MQPANRIRLFWRSDKRWLRRKPVDKAGKGEERQPLLGDKPEGKAEKANGRIDITVHAGQVRSCQYVVATQLALHDC